MGSGERELLEELKKTLKHPFHKGCVDAYLGSPDSKAVADVAIEQLKKVIDEAR